MLASQMFSIYEDQLDGICVFCFLDKQIISYGDMKEKTYSKLEAVRDYDLFLKQMADNPSVKDILSKGKEVDESEIKSIKI
jgi:hypothetical protein